MKKRFYYLSYDTSSLSDESSLQLGVIVKGYLDLKHFIVTLQFPIKLSITSHHVSDTMINTCISY
jgi:hypothetical protein